MSYEDLRKEEVDLLKRDLFGPYEGLEEVIELGSDETPLNRYITGVLYPQKKSKDNCTNESDQQSNDGNLTSEAGTETDDSEKGIALSSNYHPSCFGMSFACKKDISHLKINVEAAKYIRVTNKNEDNESKYKVKWKREKITFHHLQELNIPGNHLQIEISSKLFLRIFIRTDNLENKPVTISLVNENVSTNSMVEEAEHSFFQVYISANSSGEEYPFIDRKPKPDISDEEMLSSMLLYRNIRFYAVGHGCSVNWREEKDGCAKILESSFTPEQLVYPLLPPHDLGLPEFRLKSITNSSPEELCKIFESLTNKYEAWIENRVSEAKLLPSNFQRVAAKQIDLCKESLKRMWEGIELLGSNPDAYTAFILGHKAMLHQFNNSERKKLRLSPEELKINMSRYKWHPFQIAFILQCFESIINPHSKYRETMDLLWFPTGGGKTEAYLGLIAITLFYRRIRESNTSKKGGGTSVLTRYTLRLLTIDQFYRSASLICACEVVRKNEPALQETAPINIGLWVGGESSPNTVKEAEENLDKVQQGTSLSQEADPVKLLECPWCGTPLNASDYKIHQKPSRLVIKCSNSECEFKNGLPVWVVDEDIYRERPALVIGTVDKFARLPWVKDAGNIFSSDNEYSPPDLIIQDELHLITGPLGTMVGAYETAIDILCKGENDYSAKIIASTATIRNAFSQVKGLFARETRQFPQPCINYEDSFFAKEDRTAKARLYVGIFIPGYSAATSLVRTYACLLHATLNSNVPDSYKDPYWTLVGYFNSLRELGSTNVMVYDDVRDYLKILTERDQNVKNEAKMRYLSNICELTSRVTTSELETYRIQLWSKYGEPDCPDIVLATNMISVGLDVPRLGLMVVTGQPKSTAEYIQATSRVGRSNPGLIVTIYNVAHSRDRSHYERFITYHKRLYSEVEAASVTPFSSRAMDRSLHAIFITLVRHLVPGMSDNESVRFFDSSKEEIIRIKGLILERVTKTDPAEINTVKIILNEIIEKWERMREIKDLCYYSSKGPSLMTVDINNAESFLTMNSLRNIDFSSLLKNPQ